MAEMDCLFSDILQYLALLHVIISGIDSFGK